MSSNANTRTQLVTVLGENFFVIFVPQGNTCAACGARSTVVYFLNRMWLSSGRYRTPGNASRSPGCPMPRHDRNPAVLDVYACPARARAAHAAEARENRRHAPRVRACRGVEGPRRLAAHEIDEVLGCSTNPTPPQEPAADHRSRGQHLEQRVRDRLEQRTLPVPRRHERAAF